MAKPVADNSLVDSKTAMAILGVKPQTFYAYVSRGLIRPAPVVGSKRRMYYRGDVEAAAMKGRAGRLTFKSTGLSAPPKSPGVMHTSITFITAEGPVYRGHPAIELALAGRSYEDCIELLWKGVLPRKLVVWPAPDVPPTFEAFARAICQVAGSNTSRELLSLAAQAYVATLGQSMQATAAGEELAARQLIQIMACAFGLLRESPQLVANHQSESLATTIARSSGIEVNKASLAALNSCLIVAADHELTPSTFVARIAASAGADMTSCVGSALGSFETQQNGVGCDECEQSFSVVDSQEEYIRMLQEAISQHKQAAGYSHFAYPLGDPRGRYLLHVADALSESNGTAQTKLAWIKAASEQLGVVPSIVAGIVAVCAALGMPAGSAGALMALSRCSGWVAHAFEQRLTRVVVRPRARYIGATLADA